MSELPRRLETIQRRLRFFDFSLDCLAIAKKDGTFIDLNNAWEETLGFDLETLKSRPSIELIHPEDREKTARIISGLQKAGEEGVRFRSRCLTRDGSHRWMVWKCRLADDVIYMVGRDVHWLTGEGRRQIRQASPAAARREPTAPGETLDMRYAWRRQRFFEFSLDMLCIASGKGYFVDLNPSWERTLGYSIEELTSRPYFEFVHPDDQGPTVAEAARLQEPETYTVGFANRYRCKDGSYRWLHWVSRTVDGWVYAIARDITPLVKTAAGDDIHALALIDAEALAEDE
jgi:rsbT co-antagonist protein RsbR